MLGQIKSIVSELLTTARLEDDPLHVHPLPFHAPDKYIVEGGLLGQLKTAIEELDADLNPPPPDGIMTADEMRSEMMQEVPLMDDGRLEAEYNSMFGKEAGLVDEEDDTQ